MPTLWVALATKMTKKDNDRLRLKELKALDENDYKFNNVLSCTKLESR